ncbi:hypothetical protein BDV35DRAFT_356399 [Aspergillus flavus]|uniref:Uncharacterized protein n=1 Tax=Aspergillus flavus TaxID=5059 RepID=A0A5N6GTN2_ASPFL|nr:hypothetical protein BDV35DRAFT_356399 [Aspergillus flavus]
MPKGGNIRQDGGSALHSALYSAHLLGALQHKGSVSTLIPYSVFYESLRDILRGISLPHRIVQRGCLKPSETQR